MVFGMWSEENSASKIAVKFKKKSRIHILNAVWLELYKNVSEYGEKEQRWEKQNILVITFYSYFSRFYKILLLFVFLMKWSIKSEIHIQVLEQYLLQKILCLVCFWDQEFRIHVSSFFNLMLEKEGLNKIYQYSLGKLNSLHCEPVLVFSHLVYELVIMVILEWMTHKKDNLYCILSH